MAETGDWVTPRLYGKPWFEKPPLYYWGAAISFKLFGVSEAAARLPSAISALLATLAMAWLAWRIYGGETARWLLLLLPTTVGMIGFSHAAAAAAFCVTALPWYILCARRNPDFFRIFIIEHNFKRYVTPEFQHIQSFWFYLPVLFVALYPWIGMTISSITSLFRRKIGTQLDNAASY